MSVVSLGYAVIGSRNLAEWQDFGTSMLGLHCAERSSSLLGFRMDSKRRRILVDGSAPDGTCCFAWDMGDAGGLAALAARVEAAGTPVTSESSDFAGIRHVRDLISFRDPSGNRVEAFHGLMGDADPFQPGRTISGFRTGALGMGHAVLTVARAEETLAFYRDTVGFRVSDYMLSPFKAYFLHCNGRHHSLAIIETGRDGVHHLMMELFSLDDVGQGYDLAIDRGSVNVTLGRHSNDFMTSFYVKTPSPFMIEYGWGGREIDPRTWTPRECVEGPSLWGHERHWMPEEGRAQARAMRKKAACQGIRHPVQVIAGNYEVMPGACPWTEEAGLSRKAETS